MTKKEFILKLKEHLVGMNQNEKREVLLDYEEHFFDGIKAGRSEDEICDSLGNPEEIAKNLMASSSYSQENTEKNDGVNMAGYIIGIIALSLGCLWLLQVLLGLGFAPIGIIIGMIAVLFLPLSFGIKFIAISALVFSLSLTIIFILLMIKLVIQIIRWYKQLINGLSNDSQKKITREFKMFKPKSWVWITLTVILVVSFAGMVIGGITYGADIANKAVHGDFGSIEDIDEFVLSIEDMTYDIEAWEDDFDRFDDIGHWSFFGGIFNFGSEFETHETFDLAGIDTLNVTAVSSDIVLVKGSESKAYYHGRTSGSKKIYVDKSGSTLDIEVEKGWHSGFTKAELLITLTKEDFEKLNVNCVSGSVKVSDISAKDLQIKTTSGSLDYDGLNKEVVAAYFKSTSGGMDISNVIASKQIEAKNTSGSIELIDCEGNFDISNTSGRISVSGNIGSSDSYIKNTSGRVEVDIDDKPSSINATTTSGNVSINDASGYTVDEKSKKSFVGKNPNSKSGSLTIKNTSGGIDIIIK